MKMLKVVSTIMSKKPDKMDATKTEVAFNAVFLKALKEDVN